MEREYIILKFSNRRVVLRNTEGKAATYTQHLEGHVTLDFDGCEFVGSVIVTGDDPDPDLKSLLVTIDKQYAPDYPNVYGLPVLRYIGATRDGIEFRTPEIIAEMNKLPFPPCR